MRRAEQCESVRAHNAFYVFKYLHVKMAPPRNTSAESTQFHLRARYQRYVVPGRYEPPAAEALLYRELVKEGLVVEIKAMGDKQQKAIDHMRNVYQLSVTRAQANSRQLMARSTTCWCSSCSTYNYAGCVLGNAAQWRKINLQKAEGYKDEEGKRIQEMFIKDGGAKGHMVAVWVEDEAGGRVTYGEIMGEPRVAGHAQLQNGIARGEWWVPVHLYTAWEHEDGVYVRNEDHRDASVCMHALVLPPNDPRPPSQHLRVERRAVLHHPAGTLPCQNVYIDAPMRAEVAQWAGV